MRTIADWFDLRNDPWLRGKASASTEEEIKAGG